MKNEVRVDYSGNMSFETEMTGHKIRLDVDKESGGEDNGIRPKPLMLTALAGCTGLDVVSLLKKMRVEYKKISVTVQGELTEEHPIQYKSMHVVYEITGDEINEKKVTKAVDLSLDRYCGVAAVYKKVMPVTYEIKLL